MSEFRKALFEEINFLRKAINNLEALMALPRFPQVSEENKRDLNEQMTHMLGYLAVMERRWARHSRYEILDEPDPIAVLDNGSQVIPLATLNDGYGGVSHIVEDDHCYVLLNKIEDGTFVKSLHWFPEAVIAMKLLPLPERG